MGEATSAVVSSHRIAIRPPELKGSFGSDAGPLGLHRILFREHDQPKRLDDALDLAGALEGRDRLLRLPPARFDWICLSEPDPCLALGQLHPAPQQIVARHGRLLESELE